MSNDNSTAALMEYQIRSKNSMPAYLLWFFLGMCGAHNFYLGRTKQAVWQLVLTLLLITSPVTAVWILVDVFRIGGFLRAHNGAVAAEITQRYGTDVLAHLSGTEN